MTRKLLLLTLGACFVLLGTVAHAKDEGTARELFDTLPTLIRAEAEAKRLNKLPQGAGQSDPAYLLSFFRNAREYLENGDEASATQQIRQLEYASVTDPVRDACETVVTRLVKERTNREAAAVAEVSGALQRAGEAVLKSKVPKDLDTTLGELAVVSEKRARIRTNERGNDAFNANSRLQMAIKFVARWQDYLLAVNRNDARQITDQLRSLSSETETFQALGIPRSEMIGRVPPTSLPAETITPTPSRRVVSVAEVNAALENAYSRLKVLDDLQPVIHDLVAFRDEMNASSGGYGSNSSDLLNTLNVLQGLQQAYLELQTGLNRGQFLPALNRYDGSGNGRYESRLVGLRAQLIALSLPRLLGAPDTEKPTEGERVDKFLDRLLAEARKRGDWAAVARGVEARRQLAPNSVYDGGRSEYGGDETAFKQFFAGQNFEQASQYAQAVASYLAALATGSQEIPVALISERLAAIKQAHPLEYANADRSGLPRRMVMPVQMENMAAPEASTDNTATPTPSSTPTPSPTPTPTPKPTPTASPLPTP